MLNIKPLTTALISVVSFILYTPLNALANDDYTILACDGCTHWSMQRKAETLADLMPQTVHVYNNLTGALKAYVVKIDLKNGAKITSSTSPSPVAAQRAVTAYQAANAVPEPVLPASISDSAWDFANFPARQNEVRDWLSANADWQVAALAKVQTASDLFRSHFRPQNFIVHLQSGGKISFKSDSHMFDFKGMRLHLVFDYAEDKDGNPVAQTKSDLTRHPYSFSGGIDGTGNAMAGAATLIFGVGTVSFNVNMGSGSSGSFTCSSSPEGLVCVKIK